MYKSETLSIELLEAYSEANLNKIARNLIRLYKEKQYEKLNILAGLIADWVQIEIEPDGRNFSKIISLYHPDRGEFYRSKITESAQQNDLPTLEKFTHIFVIQDIEEIAANIVDFEDIDYHPEYVWDVKDMGFNSYREKKKKHRKHARTSSSNGYTFYEAMQIRQYGDIETNFPGYYLEDMDEVELSESGINDLEGIENCIHTISIDLSGNQIADLSPLSNLSCLQELNLANNQLSYIDALGYLQQLKSLDLSYNSIDDISPLLEIETLEFVDLTGNKIKPDQLNELRDLGVTVEF